jgi:hypothetical protein
MCGSWASSQARPIWAGVTSSAAAAATTAGVVRHLWPGREGRPEREERNPGQVVLATLVQERLVRPVEEVVEDLDASRCQRATPGMGTLAWQCPGDRTMNDLMLGAAGLEPTTSCSQSKLLRLSSLA